MAYAIQSGILDWLSGEMPTPIPYGSFSQSWFHYLSLLIAFLAAYTAIRFLKNGSPTRVRLFVLGGGILITLFEIYKQVIMNYGADGTYQWYIFPFQFCSTPIYIMMLAGIAKPGKFQTIMYEFLATFGLFGGISVLFYPNSVFISLIGINIQTMVHHGTMFVVGVALLASVIKINKKALIRASLVFLTLVAIAMTLNLLHNTFIGNAVFNMFFLNERYGNHLPILSTIFAIAPYPVFLLAYLLGFIACAAVMLLLGYGYRMAMQAPHGHKRLSHQ